MLLPRMYVAVVVAWAITPETVLLRRAKASRKEPLKELLEEVTETSDYATPVASRAILRPTAGSSTLTQRKVLEEKAVERRVLGWGL